MYKEFTFNSLFEYPGNEKAVKICESMIKYPNSKIIVGDDGKKWTPKTEQLVSVNSV